MRFRSFALAALTALAVTETASAATYVVAPGGDDAHDGVAMPWATLQHAADSVKAGDTVKVQAGSYQGFNMTAASGVAGSPITFAGEAGAIISTENPDTPDGINVEGVSYVVIQGFTVNGMARTGIRTALTDHVTIRDNKLDKNGKWGILTGFADDLLIEGNETSNAVEQHGIYVGNSAKRPTIRNNLIWGNAANGIHMNGDVSQQPGDGLIREALVEGNIIYDNGALGGSGINGDGLTDSVIRNNLIYAEHASGISLYMIDASDGAKNNLVINNTIIEAANGRWALNIQQNSTGNKAFNNIFLNLNPAHGSVSIASEALPGLESDYNIIVDKFDVDDTFITLATWRSMTGQDAHSFTATPAELFADVAGDDYHLSMASLAIDKGTSTSAPDHDIEGNPRPTGAAIDIGAYELCTGDCGPSTGGAGPGGSGPGGAGPGGSGPGGEGGAGAGPSAGGAGGEGGTGFKSNETTGDTGGCGCRAAGSDVDARWGAWIAGIGALIAARRRARRAIRG